jgi:hypothetical protein
MHDIFTTSKLKFYLTENKGWQKTLSRQENEIPAMKEMLNGIIEQEGKPGATLFNNQLAAQQTKMKLLHCDLQKQQQRLQKDVERDITLDVDAFLLQDILRDRIKAVEKLYIDLKCNCMNFLATMA